MNSYSFKKPAWSFFFELFKGALFKRVTKNALPLFVKGDDRIAGSMATGVYEEYLVEFFKSRAALGLNDFFIDIGANIGLISCQVGNSFKTLHMYEPNPVLVKILEANCQLTLGSNVTVHPYGLSNREDAELLTIPKGNWGGAFIDDEKNSYDRDTLAAKDGFSQYDSDNYLSLEIKVKNVHAEMAHLFGSLRERGFYRGCMKIDVEGFEETILEGILDSIPGDFELMVALESWGQNAFSCLQENSISDRVTIANLSAKKGWVKDWRWVKAIQVLLRGSYQLSTARGYQPSETGDTIVWIRKSAE